MLKYLLKEKRKGESVAEAPENTSEREILKGGVEFHNCLFPHMILWVPSSSKIALAAFLITKAAKLGYPKTAEASSYSSMQENIIL